MVNSFLSEADAREVEAAIARLEEKTSAEVVVAVVPRSQSYWLGRVAVAAAWSVGAALALLHFVHALSPFWIVLLQIPIGLAVFALFGIPALHRALIPRAAAAEAVGMRAFATFAARGLHQTRSRTGLLVFVSELEHRVVILGDTALHAELGDAGWQREVDELISSIRRGRAREGLLKVLSDLEPTLVRLAPPVAGDVNELSNAVVRD